MRAQKIEHFRDPLPTFASLAAELKSVAFGNKSTIAERRGGVDFLFNEFWTARQRQANRLHEISYRACFKPQLPEFFISRLTRPGETVYDPFMGRGTTLLQAALMGRRASGNDINPLSRMLIRPRLNPPSLEAIVARLQEIEWKFAGPLQSDLSVFFHERTLAQIHALREWFFSREAAGEFDDVDDWLRMTAISRLTGHSSGFFSVYTLPPNQAVSIEAQRKINHRRDQAPPQRDVAAILVRKSRNLLSMPKPLRMRDEASLLLAGSAEATPAIETGSVDLVVTSPPFLDVVQYAADNWLRCWFAGIDPAGVPIAMHRRPQDWTAFVRRTFRELARVVRAGGHVAFEVGEVRNGVIELDELVLNAAAGLPFEPLCVLVNVQEFTKTAHCWGVGNNTKGTNTNRVVVFRRTADRPAQTYAGEITPP